MDSISPASQAPARPKKQTWIWWVVGAAALLLLVCCCLIILGLLIFRNPWFAPVGSPTYRTPTRAPGQIPVQPPTAWPEPTVPAEPPEPIERMFTLWYAFSAGGDQEEALYAIVDHVMIENPEFNILVENHLYDEDFISEYKAAVASGVGPDLLLSNVANLGLLLESDGWVLPLEENLEPVGYQPAALAALTVDGQLYGLPLYSEVVGLYYNKAILPDPPQTTDELLVLVQSGYGLGIAYGSYFPYGFWGAFGGALMDDSGRCIADQGGFVPALEYLLALQDAGALVYGDYVDVEDEFTNGILAMTINGPWARTSFEEALGSDLGLVPLPDGPVGPASPLVNYGAFFVNPNTPDPQAAFRLALELTGEVPSQLFSDLGGYPAVRADFFYSEPILQSFSLAATFGTPFPPHRALENYWGPFTAMFEDVLAGRISPEDGVFRACEEMNEANDITP